MNRELAEKYLSTLNEQSLDRSIGAVVLVKNQKNIENFESIIQKVKDNLFSVEEQIAELNQALSEIDKAGIIKKAFLYFQLKKQKQNIQMELESCKDRVGSWKYTIGYYEQEIERMQREIKEFCEELKKEGLTSNDILDLYDELKQGFIELKTNKDVQNAATNNVSEKSNDDNLAKTNAKQEKTLEEKNDTQKSVQEEKYQQSSAIDSFNRRMQRHQEIVNSKKQKQPGEED